MPNFSLHDLLDATLLLWLASPVIFGLFAVACLFAAWKFALHVFTDAHEDSPNEPIPYEPRSFATPAAKGFARDHRGTVVSMQARKRDGNEAA